MLIFVAFFHHRTLVSKKFARLLTSHLVLELFEQKVDFTTDQTCSKVGYDHFESAGCDFLQKLAMMAHQQDYHDGRLRL